MEDLSLRDLLTLTKGSDGKPPWCIDLYDSKFYDCPFVVLPSYEEQEGVDISNDRSEAHYDCRLLKRKVWAEYSECDHADWQTLIDTALDDLEKKAGVWIPLKS